MKKKHKIFEGKYLEKYRKERKGLMTNLWKYMGPTHLY